MLGYILLALAILISVPIGVLFIEVCAACVLPASRPAFPSRDENRSPVAVIVPAHNESVGLSPTLIDIKTQLRSRDRLVVVADNCTDDTAAVAVANGAEAIERTDPDKQGKGYALAFALDHLSNDPPATVIIVDADCRVDKGTIDGLAMLCQSTQRPVQALDLMLAPASSPVNYRVAEFAWRVRNWVRPLGLSALGLPCQLMGTGMALPWTAMRSMNLASGSIVEDTKLGLDLAKAGRTAIFYPLARVTSEFPQTPEAARIQRTRWEQGNLKLLVTAVPRLLSTAVITANFGLLALAVDALVPPLSLLALVSGGMFFLAGLAAFFGMSPHPFYVCAIALTAFFVAVIMSWFKFGRDVLPPGSLLSIVGYAITKVGLYRRILVGRWRESLDSD